VRDIARLVGCSTTAGRVNFAAITMSYTRHHRTAISLWPCLSLLFALGCDSQDAPSTGQHITSNAQALLADDAGVTPTPGDDSDGGAAPSGNITGNVGTPEKLSEDFSLAEGPVWDHCGKRLLFTDINKNAIYQLNGASEISTYRENVNYPGSLAYDADGRLNVAELGGGQGGRIERIELDGSVTVLANQTPGGQKLNTTDDLTLRSDGTIYFTDPVIPHANYTSFSFSQLPIYRLSSADQPLVQEFQTWMPNGIELSPDEKTLYVNNSLGQVLQFDVNPDGSLTNERTLIAGLTGADSGCMDVKGNLYVGISGGLAVVSPQGERIGTIDIDANAVTNCAFGGEDGKTLYVTAWTSLWRVTNLPIEGHDWQLNKRIKCQ
jgi:gluconolactonase